MTTMYRPVEITSAEHAEAQPAGTIAYTPGDDGRPVGTAHRLPHGDPVDAWDEGERTYTNSQMVGDVALVPIEADEELVEQPTLCQKIPDVLTRYVTPWQRHTPKETK